MRLKDLRWHILGCVILIISYLAIAFCYYLPIRSKAEESMKVLAHEAIEIEKELAYEKINSYYQTFLIDSDTLDTDFNQTGLKGKFDNLEGDKIIFSQDKLFVFQSINTSYYFYFLNDEGKCGRLSLNELFGESNFDVYAYAAGGSIYYTNTEFEGALMSELLGDNFNISESLGEDDTFTQVYNVLDERGVISSVNLYDNVYIATFIEIDDPYLAIDWVLSQALVFYSIGIVILVIMLVILVLGCQKSSKLLRVDRHATRATNSVIIRIDESGKTIFTNKTFKKIYGLRKLIDISEFKEVKSNENIMVPIQKNKAFECYILIEGETKYFYLTPLHISKSYYLVGADITIDFIRRKHLEEMNGKNEITLCDNSLALTNQFQHILIENEYKDLAFVQYQITKYEEIVGVFGRDNFNDLLIGFLSILKDIYKDVSIYHIDDSKFIVIQPNESINEVVNHINTVLDVLRRPFTINSNNIYVNCKVVVYNLKKEEFAEVGLKTIMSKLELAMKNIADFSSKDYIVYDPAMDRIIVTTEEMEKYLIKGLKENEFRMYLQPQYNIKEEKIDGFEALLRWVNPKYKEKSPQEYVELAEQRGHMLDVGRFVIKESFKLAKELEKYNIHISINVSPIQILQVGFAGEIIESAESLQLNPNNIAIEITESFLMENFVLVNEKLKLLKQKGFRIHLDDFCTGYSSMLYLKDLPVDTIKIDKEFTKYVETSKVNSNIVKTICSLGNSLDLGIICEGVETEEQKDIVSNMGCDIIQGFLISKAVPFEKAKELLEKHNKPKEKEIKKVVKTKK
jgi:EAL domain-containing protein (putative c-di-GMP-specific phosphodiesterase class I)/GGDEF domain-containing protein